MGKTNTKKIQIWLICIICFLFACLLAVSVTAAYFGMNRKFEGTLEFSNGVKIDYLHVEANGDKSFTLLKLGNKETINDFDGTNLTPLNEASSDVSSADVFYIANPEIKPADDTIPYYLRFSLRFYTEYQDGGETKSKEMKPEEIKNVFGSENPIALNKDQETNNSPKFVYKENRYSSDSSDGGYYYLVKPDINEGELDRYSDLHVNEPGGPSKYLLFGTSEMSGVRYYTLYLAETVDYYMVDNFKIVLNIETIDARDGNSALNGDIWNIDWTNN